jgi:hypothetical protein
MASAYSSSASWVFAMALDRSVWIFSAEYALNEKYSDKQRSIRKKLVPRFLPENWYG